MPSQLRFQIGLRTLLLAVFAFSALTAIGVRRHQALTKYEDDCFNVMLIQLPQTNYRRMPSINVISYIGDRDAGQIGHSIKHGDKVWIEVTVTRPTFPLYSYNGIVICNRLDDDRLLSMAEYNQIADQHPEMGRFNMP